MNAQEDLLRRLEEAYLPTPRSSELDDQPAEVTLCGHRCRVVHGKIVPSGTKINHDTEEPVRAMLA